MQSKKKELKALKEIDDKLLAKSSLNIDLLPETQQDRQMASLMKLQSKSAYEREEERRLDILMKPALPSATQTTFGGLKRQKALNSQLQYEQLGIKRKLNTAETEANTSEEFVEAKKVSNPSEVRNENENTKDKSRDDENISQHQTVPVLVDLPKSLALVCDYASSNSSSPSPSQHSDNDGE